MRRRALLILAVALPLSACADDPAAPPAAASDVTPTARQGVGVAVFGTLTERNGDTLVLTQRALRFEPSGDVSVRSAFFEPAIGLVDGRIRVVVDASTQIYGNGERVFSLDGIPLQANLVVAGTAYGAGIKAAMLSEFAGPPPPTRADAPSGAPPGSEVQPAHVALCVGQNMDYDDPSILEFHGCWGGPSASGRVAVPDILLGCLVVGTFACFFVDEVSYTAALGGWTFDWPFQFAAGFTQRPLTYHVPTPITLHLTALPASGTAFTFAGGLGVDVGLHLALCPTRIPDAFECVDAGTTHINILTTAHQTMGAGPLRSDQTLQIGEVACPSIGLLPVELPVNPVSLGICEDLDLIGEPFLAIVQVAGASGQIGRTGVIVDFDGAGDTRMIRPDSTSVQVTYREFEWSPTLTVGLKFTIDVIGGINLWTSPTIPIYRAPWTPVTTPYPSTGAGFSLAADPENLIEVLHQPTFATLGGEQVAPAPTTLTVISPPILQQGVPMRARLTESYDGSPIVGAELRFSHAGASGTVVMFDTTDALGIAETIPPSGEHDVLVEYAGRDVYLPSSATQHVFVYLPTRFVIWGGNPGGVTSGGRYAFWGAQWHTHVAGGDFTADASFKGYAETVMGDAWVAGGGNSSRPPEEIGGLISVIVSTVITKQGDVTVGNVAGQVILQVENPDRYRPDPGHAGFGIMIAEVPGDPDEGAAVSGRVGRDPRTGGRDTRVVGGPSATGRWRDVDAAGPPTGVRNMSISARSTGPITDGTIQVRP